MTPSTVREGRGRGAWDTLVRGLRLSPELRVGLTVTLVLALVATAGRAVVPIAVQGTIDVGLNEGRGPVDLRATALLVAGAFVALLVTALASALMNARLVRVTETALSTLRVRAFGHIHDLSMLHQAREQRGALVSRVTSDVDEISRFMQWGGLNLVTGSAQLLVATAVMAAYSWQLTLVVLATFFPLAAIARWFQLRLTEAYMVVRARVGRLLGVVAETVVGAPVVRAYGIEERTGERLSDAIDHHYGAATRAGRITAVFSGTSELFAGLATAAVVVVGVLLGAGGAVSPGTVVAFLFLIALFVQPVQIVAETINEAQTAIAGWRRVLDVLDLEPDVADPGDAGVDLPPGPVGIRFEGVDFRYPGSVSVLDGGGSGAGEPGPLVLQGVDVAISAQTRVAVVGETGSGKTTFAKLLTRLMDPVAGRVLVNGVPIDQVRFASLRRRIVMVPQDGMLFAGSIADNVRHGRPEITDEEIELEFLELGLSDWLDTLEQGIHTEVGERGNALSSGERQLVALARAYVANPDLLVLDEATSAVDPATEVRLQRALAGLTSGRTTVTIAHRLSTAESADEILVFDAGRIVQRGRHEELVAVPGVYADLHASWRAGTRAG